VILEKIETLENEIKKNIDLLEKQQKVIFYEN